LGMQIPRVSVNISARRLAQANLLAELSELPIAKGRLCSITMQTEGETVTDNYMLLTSPNDIGPVPQPTESMLVPPDSPRILVGCSTLADGKTVV
ncbi:hypothetical protein ACC689_34885, partial [Rhizobium ruizarguesonis]